MMLPQYSQETPKVVIEPSLIRRNYLTSWFLIDLLSCLPYDIFYMFKNEDEGKGTLFSTLKVVRLLRLGRVARKLDNYLEYGAATLLLLLCAYVLVAHWMACLWYTIGEIELKFRMQDINYPDNWLVKLGNDLKQPYIFNNTVPLINGTFKQITDKFKLIGGPDRQTCYLSALYFAVSSVSTVGYGNVSGTTDLEKLFAVVMMLTGSLMYAAIFGHMTTIIQQMTSSTARYHEIISNVREFIKLQEIPRELSERIMDYISWSSAKGIDTGKVLGYCPKDMKSDICVHLNRKIFKEHGCFALASDGCLRSFALSLESIHIAPGNLLYHTGESVDALWFVAQGSLEIIQDEEVVAILGKGDVFGDEFWKGTYIGQSTANVRALTYTDLHMIKKEHLMEILNFYKSFGNSFSRSLTLTYNLTHRLRFRKMVDVLREKELDERRKHEKFTLAEDHPERLNVLTHGMQSIQENSTEARANFERLQHQVSNIERLLTQFFNSRQGGIATPSTRAMGSYSALPGDGSPYNERASESWTFFPSTQATQLGSGGMMQQSSISPNIPPLRHLSVDNPSSPMSGEEDDIATNMVPLIFIDQASTPGSSSTSRNTSAPPLNRSGPHHPQFHRP
uniref:Cyclic nucleotide-binding domain-containing protein n=1 Tax=Rhabditophanes sp. KR3021 TaxID=114890 RepID=A0AC35UHI6_9BILA